MRVRTPRRRALRRGALGALWLLCASIAIAVGDEPARLTVANKTPHVLDVVIADRTFPGLAPGSEATYSTSGDASVTAKASYSAGQDVEGTAVRTFSLVAVHPGSTRGTGVFVACSTAGVVTNPAVGGPVFWNVTADTLATR